MLANLIHNLIDYSDISSQLNVTYEVLPLRPISTNGIHLYSEREYEDRVRLTMRPSATWNAGKYRGNDSRNRVVWTTDKNKESAGKPGSVEDNHSSVMPVTRHL